MWLRAAMRLCFPRHSYRHAERRACDRNQAHGYARENDAQREPRAASPVTRSTAWTLVPSRSCRSCGSIAPPWFDISFDGFASHPVPCRHQRGSSHRGRSLLRGTPRRKRARQRWDRRRRNSALQLPYTYGHPAGLGHRRLFAGGVLIGSTLPATSGTGSDGALSRLALPGSASRVEIEALQHSSLSWRVREAAGSIRCHGGSGPAANLPSTYGRRSH